MRYGPELQNNRGPLKKRKRKTKRIFGNK